MNFYYRLRNEMGVIHRTQTYNFEDVFIKAARIASERGSITLLNVAEWGDVISRKIVKVSVSEIEENLNEL